MAPLPDISSLPISEVLEEALTAVVDHGALALKAPTGAGKTTGLPLALLQSGHFQGRIHVTQPRRVAARSCARRIAELLGEAAGERVGYHVRFDRKVGKSTQLVVSTEGILLQELARDPFLEDIEVLVFDEFHERSADLDLALALARQLRDEVRPDLKIVVMSATLDMEPVARWLNAQALESRGRSYPIDVSYQPPRERERLEAQVLRALRKELEKGHDDILVFLPGVGEIERCRDLAAEAQLDCELRVLHGSLRAEEQDALFRVGPRRRVIFSTNIAETSLTLPRIGSVIDSGSAKVMRFDEATGLNRLVLEPISRASSEQRSGRAGRLKPGRCVRLWSEHTQQARRAHDEPEIHRIELSETLLRLAAWGEPNPLEFSWFESPRLSALQQASSYLHGIGALGAQGISRKGEQIAALPLPPRLAALALSLSESGYRDAAADVCALLNERDIVHRSHRTSVVSRSDIVDRRDALHGDHHRFPRRDLVQSGVQTVRKTSKDLRRSLSKVVSTGARSQNKELESALDHALLQAWPDRVCRRRASNSPRALMASGRGVTLDESSGVKHAEYFVALTLSDGPSGRRSESLVRIAHALDPDNVEDLAREQVRVFYDSKLERVSARESLSLGDLELRSRPCPIPMDVEVGSVLFDALAPESADFFAKPKGLGGFLARLDYAHRVSPDEWESAEQLCLRTLKTLCVGKSSRKELAREDLRGALEGSLGWNRLQELNRAFPERYTVASGSSILLQYPVEGPPVLAVRIQEVLGTQKHPTIQGGRTPLQLHLLAPNQRPQQITMDLPGFWQRTYVEVRKELRQRYPKHAWPEDPANAKPERRPQRKRS